MKLAVIGNSHVAARRDAIRMGLVDLGDLDVTFWALPSGQFQSVRYEDGVLRSNFPETTLLTSGGRYADLPLGAFDVLLFEGMKAQIGSWTRGCYHPGKTVRSFSRGLLKAGIAANLETRGMFQLARQVASATGKRVMAAPAPIICLFDPTGFLDLAPEDVAIITALATDIFRQADLELIPQAPETLTPTVHTRTLYAVSVTRLADHEAEVEAGQRSHMNGHFGALLWRETLRRLGSGAAGDPGGAPLQRQQVRLGA